MGEVGAEYLRDALIHPGGPKSLTSLSMDRDIDVTSMSHMLTLVVGCHLENKGIKSLCDALIHPEGPKDITYLDLECGVWSHTGGCDL